MCARARVSQCWPPPVFVLIKGGGGLSKGKGVIWKIVKHALKNEGMDLNFPPAGVRQAPTQITSFYGLTSKFNFVAARGLGYLPLLGARSSQEQPGAVRSQLIANRGFEQYVFLRI